MRIKLALIALLSFAVSALCLGSAFGFMGGFENFGSPRCELQPTGRSATRSLAWDGSDRAGVAVPATVHYRRGQGDRVVVTGDSALLPHVRLVDGWVEFDCHPRDLNGLRLDVSLPGREFRGFSLAGLGDMDLEGIDQPDLSLHVAGAGNVTATGQTDNLDLHLAGAGHARLGGLSAGRVALHLAGSSNVEVAPRDDLSVHIAGAGTVVLYSEPRSIETHIAGSGRIIHADGSQSGSRHAMTGRQRIPA
ncbi:MAG: GIN domain-containing protein [Rhizomicrobium sp.]